MMPCESPFAVGVVDISPENMESMFDDGHVFSVIDYRTYIRDEAVEWNRVSGGGIDIDEHEKYLLDHLTEDDYYKLAEDNRIHANGGDICFASVERFGRDFGIVMPSQQISRYEYQNVRRGLPNRYLPNSMPNPHRQNAWY